MREKIRTYIHEKIQIIKFKWWYFKVSFRRFKAKIRKCIEEKINNFWWKVYIWVEKKALDYDLNNDHDRFEPCETEGEGDNVRYL